MVCVCGGAFCWGCGKDYSIGSQHALCFYRRHDKNGTTAVLLEHIIRPKTAGNYAMKRTSLYMRAVYHHNAQYPVKLARYHKQGINLITKLMVCATFRYFLSTNSKYFLRKAVCLFKTSLPSRFLRMYLFIPSTLFQRALYPNITLEQPAIVRDHRESIENSVLSVISILMQVKHISIDQQIA